MSTMTAKQALTYLQTIHPQIDWHIGVDVEDGIAGHYIFPMEADSEDRPEIRIGRHDTIVGLMVVLHELGHYYDYITFPDGYAFMEQPWEVRERNAQRIGWGLVLEHGLKHLVLARHWDKLHAFIDQERSFDSYEDYLAFLELEPEPEFA